VVAWRQGAGGLAGVIPGSILSASSQEAPRSRDHAQAGTHATSTAHRTAPPPYPQQRTRKDQHVKAPTHPNGTQNTPAENSQSQTETKTRPGGDDRACLARSLRTEKASSVAFESRSAWLTRTLLPPEPQKEPYNQPPPPMQPPPNTKPRKMEKTELRRGPLVTGGQRIGVLQSPLRHQGIDL
jgi:hypothetical protein